MAQQPQAVLKCAVCAGAQRGTDRIADEGWFECRFCGELSTIPGAGVFVTRAPGNQVTEVIRPGRRSFVIRNGLGSPVNGAAIVFLSDLPGSAVLAVARLLGPFGAWAIGILYYGIVVGIAIWLRRSATRAQHIHIHDDGRIQVERESARGRKGTVSTTLGLLAARKEPEELCSTDQPRILLHRGGRAVVRIAFASAAERDWVFTRLRAAAQNTGQVDLREELRCDGCGGALGRRAELSEAGSIDCPHCGTGLIYTHGGMELPRLQLDVPEAIADATDRVPRLTGKPQRKVIRIPGRRWKWNSLLWAVLPAGCYWALTWYGGWLVDRFKYYPVWVSFALLITVSPVILLAVETTNAYLRRREFVLTESALEYRDRIGPWNTRAHRFALSRLLLMRAKMDVLTVSMEIQCSTRTARFDVPLRGAVTTHALARLFAETRARAERLGRPARVERCGPTARVSPHGRASRPPRAQKAS